MICLCIELNETHIVLLCSAALAIVSGCRLKLDTFKSGNGLVRADSAEIQVSTRDDRFRLRNHLRSLVALRGMLYELDSLFAVRDACRNADQETSHRKQCTVVAANKRLHFVIREIMAHALDRERRADLKIIATIARPIIVG